MRWKFHLAAAGLGLCLASGFGSTASMADPITIGSVPSALTLQYGNFTVTSLGLDQEVTGNTKLYEVQSSPGQLKIDVVVGSGSGTTFLNGSPASTPTLAGIDAPYSTPNGNTITSFTTSTTASGIAPTQNGGIVTLSGGNTFVDTFNTWNANVGALNTALSGQAPVFYFNLNDTGVNDVLSGTDLLLWMKVTVVDSSGNAIPGQTYYVAGNPFDPNNGQGVCTGFVNCGVEASINIGKPDPNASYPDVNPPACSNPNPPIDSLGCVFYPGTPQWSYVHGNVCVLDSLYPAQNPLLHYGSCTNADPAGAKTVSQNLGANDAAFAAWNTALNTFLANPANASDTLQISWEMADENGSYEQLFILGSGATQILIPEPLTLSLFGAGLLGVAFSFRRKRATIKS
jgi:hypothetical protein